MIELVVMVQIHVLDDLGSIFVAVFLYLKLKK
jgi:hypothetical protein